MLVNDRLQFRDDICVISEGLKDLLMKMLTKDATQRITIEEIKVLFRGNGSAIHGQ